MSMFFEYLRIALGFVSLIDTQSCQVRQPGKRFCAVELVKLKQKTIQIGQAREQFYISDALSAASKKLPS